MLKMKNSSQEREYLIVNDESLTTMKSLHKLIVVEELPLDIIPFAYQQFLTINNTTYLETIENGYDDTIGQKLYNVYFNQVSFTTSSNSNNKEIIKYKYSQNDSGEIEFYKEVVQNEEE